MRKTLLTLLTGVALACSACEGTSESEEEYGPNFTMEEAAAKEIAIEKVFKIIEVGETYGNGKDLELGDRNNDGYLDIVTMDTAGRTRIYINPGYNIKPDSTSN